MKTFQKQIKLPPYKRGFHLITDLVLKSIPEIKEIKIGFAHIFIKHTSAGLMINENADPDVEMDIIMKLNKDQLQIALKAMTRRKAYFIKYKA